MILNGWPAKMTDNKFKPYFNRCNELNVHQNCVLWGSRVVIPTVLQKHILLLLHNGHSGIVKMKGLARTYVWWLNMDGVIENAAKICSVS